MDCEEDDDDDPEEEVDIDIVCEERQVCPYLMASRWFNCK